MMNRHVLLRRGWLVGAVVLVAFVLAGCNGRGGGQLGATGPVFTGPASFGFSFSCERSSNSTSTNPPAGRLRIQLSYTEHGRWALGSGFSVHGTADVLDPVLESAICIGDDPPATGNKLIFLGTYQAPSAGTPGFPRSCPAKATTSTPLCRFEVIVKDNDQSQGPSKGDFFSIRLSGSTGLSSDLDPASVFYTRAGLLESGNLTVD